MANLTVLLADTHFGVRQNSVLFHENNKQFFSEIFFPTVINLTKDHKVNIVHVGDVFDDRRKIDVNTWKLTREYFFDPLSDITDMVHLSVDIIAGNHDLYWRERSVTNTLDELVSTYPRINLYVDQPVQVGNHLYVPWINRENHKKSLDIIGYSDADYVFGHLELQGFQLHRGHLSTHGEDPNVFSKYKHVFTGHFHHKQTIGNITYLGSNQQHTWADAGDIRGFHIMDEHGRLKFIANPYNMFHTFNYGEEPEPAKYYRIRYDSSVKQTELNALVQKLQEGGAFDVQTIPNSIDATQTEVETDIDVEDTVTLFKSIIPDANVVDKMIDYYNQASLIEQ